MKSVVDARFAVGLCVPVVNALRQRFALALNGKINDGRRPAKCRRPRPVKIVRSASRQTAFHMRMRIDPTGYHQFSTRVNDPISLISSVRPMTETTILDQNIRDVIINRRHNRPDFISVFIEIVLLGYNRFSYLPVNVLHTAFISKSCCFHQSQMSAANRFIV